MTAPAEIGVVGEINASISTIQARMTALAATSASTSTSPDFSTVMSSVNRTAASPSATAATLAQPASAQPASVPALPAAASSGTTSASATAGSAVVADAEKYLGIPYVWGGESRSGMDCSGLVQTTFHDLGVNLPRTAAEQSHCGTPVSGLSNAQPGDLLFFGSPAYHVAIYAGHNQLIESPQPGQTVHKTSVYQTPTSIRRIVAPTQTAAVTGTSATGGLSAAQLTSAGLSSAVAAYAAQFAAAEARHHLPAGMLAAVAQQESGGNSRAVSPAGAEGLMQLMPSTAASAGVDPFNPSQAIEAAGRILGDSLRRYNGSVSLALAAYNAGPGAVAQYGGVPPYSETQNYVRRITAMMAAGG
jgi:cell wall-associated NlpC family hydrolase